MSIPGEDGDEGDGVEIGERRCVPVLPELVGRLILDQRYLVLACIRQKTSAYASIRRLVLDQRFLYSPAA